MFEFINNIKKRYLSNKIGIPFMFKNVKIDNSIFTFLNSTTYIDNFKSDIENNVIFVINNQLNIVLLYYFNKNGSSLLFDKYLTTYYNFNDELYNESINALRLELFNYFEKNKVVNNIYDDIPLTRRVFNFRIDFSNINTIKTKIGEYEDNEELHFEVDCEFKMQMMHINNEYTCDVDIKSIKLLDDGHIAAFTNFQIEIFKRLLNR